MKKNNLAKKKNKNFQTVKLQASALIVTLLILSAILITTLGMLSVSLTNKKVALNAVTSSQAFQSADTGVEKVMYDISTNYYNINSGTFANFNDCQSNGLIKTIDYQVELLDIDGNQIDCNGLPLISTTGNELTSIKRIKSIGLMGKMRRSVDAAVVFP